MKYKKYKNSYFLVILIVSIIILSIGSAEIHRHNSGKRDFSISEEGAIVMVSIGTVLYVSALPVAILLKRRALINLTIHLSFIMGIVMFAIGIKQFVNVINKSKNITEAVERIRSAVGFSSLDEEIRLGVILFAFGSLIIISLLTFWLARYLYSGETYNDDIKLIWTSFKPSGRISFPRRTMTRRRSSRRLSRHPTRQSSISLIDTTPEFTYKRDPPTFPEFEPPALPPLPPKKKFFKRMFKSKSNPPREWTGETSPHRKGTHSSLDNIEDGTVPRLRNKLFPDVPNLSFKKRRRSIITPPPSIAATFADEEDEPVLIEEPIQRRSLQRRSLQRRGSIGASPGIAELKNKLRGKGGFFGNE